MINKRLAASILIGLIGFLAVLKMAGSLGITWDESIYMRTSRIYWNWTSTLRHDPLTALSRDSITQNWGAMVAQEIGAGGQLTDMHPPLVKLAAAFTWGVFRKLTGDLVAYRLANAFFFAFLLAILFWWVSELGGWLAGVAAVLALAFLPRFLAYAGLLALDVPLATVSLIAAYVYWKTIERAGLRWAIPFGIVWGIALGIKNGGVLLPLGLGLWTLLFYRTRQHLVRLAIAGAVALLVFIISWPWLYFDTLARLRLYIDYFFLNHASLLTMHTYYLGEMYAKTPWHYPLVFSAAVTPLLTLLLMLAGLLGVLGSGRSDRAGWLLVLSALGPMLPFLATITAGYDGERLFLPAFPFLAALAGLGFARISERVWNLLWRLVPRLTARRQSISLRWIVNAALLVVVCAPPAAAIARLHPYELAYYSEIVGGIRGAAERGFETTFWADSYQGTLAYLNENAPQGATIWADASNVLLSYQELGRLRKDLFIPRADTIAPDGGDFAVIQARQSRYTSAISTLMLSRQPAATVQVDGALLVLVYRVR